LATRSTARSWLTTRRLGEDVLLLQDGSLRAVLESASPPAMPGAVLAVLRELLYPTQIVIQARRPSAGDSAPVLARLRASQASLTSRLMGRDTAFLSRLLVVVSCDPEGSAGLVDERAAEVQHVLEQEGLQTVRLGGRALDEIRVADAVQEGRCEARIGGRLARTLVVTRLPERLRTDGLDAVACEHDLSLHVQPLRRLRKLEASAYVTLWAVTREVLDVATERAEALLAADGVRTRRPYLQAEPALISGLPLGLDLVAARRVLTDDQLQASGSLASHSIGERRLLYGIDPGTRKPLLLDRFSLSNPNAVVLGDADARARLLILELTRARLAGTHLHLIACDTRFRTAVEALDGRTVARVAFDPFSMTNRGDRLESRIQALLAVIELMIPGLTPAAASAVEDAIAFSYAAHGYGYESNEADLVPPTLDEIRTALLRRGARLSEFPQEVIEETAGALERYTAGPGRRLLERKGQTSQLGPLSLHDLAGLPEQDQPIAEFLSVDRVWRAIPGGQRSLVLIDDAHVAQSRQAGLRIAWLMAHAEERGVGVTLATQDAEAILRPGLREAALGAGLTVLLRQTPERAERVAEAYRLTPAEQSWLLRASVDEGLLITQGRRLALRAVACDEEERLIPGGTR